MDNTELNVEKLAAELAGNTMLDETSVNDQTYQQIVAFLKTDKMNIFRTLKTAEARVRFIYKHEAYWPILQSIRKSGGGGRGEKDPSLSKQLREAGNAAFTSRDDETAMKCYNEALLAAPADPWDGQGEDMALAFANRSALFFRQENYAGALNDTKLAIKCGYPKHLKYKVYQRQAKCLSELGDFTQAKVNFNNAINFLNFSKISKEQKQSLHAEIQAAIEAIEEQADRSTCSPGEEAQEERKPMFCRNSAFPALYRGLTVKYDRARGRHVVATEHIKCGTYLALEEPVVSYLWSEYLASHCSNCLRTVTAPVPCFTCSLVIFCSDQCRVLANKTFHQYECKAVEAMTSMYQNVFVAYRAISQKPLKYFLEHQGMFAKYDYHRGGGCYEYEYESDSESGDTDLDSEDESHELGRSYHSDDYQNLYNLVTHSDKSSEADQLAFATSAALMLHYLKINNYFGSAASRETDRELNESEVLIGRLLYHLLEVVLYNGQDISQAVAWTIEKGVKVSSIGTSINSTLALFNHSCAPNTARANIGSSTVIVATEDIRKGQEVTNYYTIQYHDKILSTRQSFLTDHYKFECRCEACHNKWALFELMTKSVARPGVTAKALHHIKKMFATITKLSTADLGAGHYDRVHTMWANYYKELNVTLEKPNKGYIKLAGKLHDVLWLRWGSRSPACTAPPYRDHRINSTRDPSCNTDPHSVQAQNGKDE